MARFHRVLNAAEVWVIHEGRLLLHIGESDGRVRTVRLAAGNRAGAVSTCTVPRGAWQAAELPSSSAYAFGTNLCAPAFDYAQWELGEPDRLRTELPAASALIRRLAAGSTATRT
jgi:predicted cupin superfamily sugar epimerase